MIAGARFSVLPQFFVPQNVNFFAKLMPIRPHMLTFSVVFVKINCKII